MRAREYFVAGVLCSSALGCGDDTAVGSGLSSSSSPTAGGSSTGTSVDVSLWFGSFHRSSPLLPLDRRIVNHDSASITNLELRPDFSASQLYHRCGFEPETFEYSWMPGDEGEIVLLPPPGVGAFQFIGIADLPSLRITLGPECSSLVAHLPEGDSTWVRGEVCWVEPCEDPDRAYHASLCDGETMECEL